MAFSFYGSKRSIVKHYPEPTHELIIAEKEDVILEGVNAARMLNKGYLPDLVIYLKNGSQLSKHKSMRAINQDRVAAFKKQYPLRVMMLPNWHFSDQAIDAVKEVLAKAEEPTD